MSKHTPGPWKAIEDNGDYYVRSASQTTIADCTSWCVQTSQPACPNGIGEAEANAHLIAAAPELLEALKEAEHALEQASEYLNANGMTVGAVEVAQLHARATIAKAEGRS